VSWLLATALVFMSACGGGQPAPKRNGGAGSAGSAAAGEQPLSERECDDLIAHAVELGTYERAAKQGGAPTADDQRALASDLRARLAPGCHALSRTRYACAMAATTLDILDDCDR
jgi:hypothetical protein